MTKSLLLTLWSGSNWDWEQVRIVESLPDEYFEYRYDFSIGWYAALEDEVDIIWRYVSGGRTKIYLSNDKKDSTKLFEELALEMLDSFSEKDKQKVIKKLLGLLKKT